MITPRYRVVRVLGRGGAGEVLEAIAGGEDGFEKRVALKRLLADCANDEDFLRAFGDEARIASQLNHAGIVAVFDYGLLDGLPFIASELVEGLDLAALEERAKILGLEIPPALALFIVTEIAHALDYAHRAKDARGRNMGIVHRDVTPENILVSYQGDVKLADFGIALARRRIQETRIGVAKGKPTYMAPEQLEMRDVDPRADIYALGVVLRRLLAAEDEELAAIVDKATRRDRRERYESAAAMAATTGRAMLSRLRDDGRTALRAFMEQLQDQEERTEMIQRRRGGADLVNLELVLNGPMKRYESVAREPVLSATPVPVVVEPGSEDEPDTELTRAQLEEEEREEVVEHLIGTTIGSYRLEALLGAGVTARVYRAQHLVFDRGFAVKILHGKLSRRERVIARLRREAKALAQLEHINVVRVHDCGTTETGLSYLVTELCLGRSLAKAIADEGPFAPERAAELARQIAAGLEAAHALGIVHRDLKPGNIMLVGDWPNEQVKIVDFGLSRIAGKDAPKTQLTRAEDLLGTPLYMAPEQVEDATQAGPSADLYALGVILYEMLAGARPFVGKVRAALHQQMYRVPPPLPPLGGAEKVAMKLLEKSPADRYLSAGAVIEALSSQELPVMNEPMSGFTGARMTSATPYWLFAGLAAVAFGIAVSVTLSKWTAVQEITAPAPVLEPVEPERPRPIPKPEVRVVVEEKVAEEPAVEQSEPEVAVSRPAVRSFDARTYEKRVAMALAEKQLELSDLSAGTVTNYRAALASKDPGRAEKQTLGLLAAISELRVDEAVLREEVAAISRRLAARKTALGPERFDALEKRWFELRKQVAAGATIREQRAVRKLAAEVER